MLRGSALLTATLGLISRMESVDSIADVASTVKQSPEHWLNRSVSWVVEIGDRGAHMTVWEDGNAELDLVDMNEVNAQSEHFEIVALTDIDFIVNKARDWVIAK